MTLFNFLKKKQKTGKKAAPKRGEPRPAKAGREAVKEHPIAPARPKKDSPTAYRVLKWPHVTEKATNLTKVNQYVFNVYERTNKPEIKKTIEDVYGVSVTSVKIIKIPAKKRRLGKIEGWRKGYKKAIVRLGQGQKIEVLPR